MPEVIVFSFIEFSFQRITIKYLTVNKSIAYNE